MKFAVPASLLLALSLFAANNAHAEGAAAAHPCEKIKTACEAAGFVKGAHKTNGKGLFKDCMQPLMAGQTVAGVTADAADVAACKEKKAEHHKYK